jgi:flagellar protein FlgJ
MSISTQSTSVYTDLNGLEQLKHTLKGDSVDDLQVVAKQFEAIFIQQMLKTMRDASLSEGLFDNNASDFYVDMLDKQMSLNLSAGRGIDLADIIVQQLSSRLNLDPEQGSEHTASENPQLDTAPSSLAVSQLLKNAESTADKSTTDKSIAEKENKAENSENRTNDINLDRNEFLSSENTKALTDPETFIKSLWPLALNAAKAIGVPPQVLIAQAALETGWGQYIAKDQNGQSSHNLFNIKAGSDWPGDTVTLATTELKNGTAVKEYAAFRAYDSYNGSFEDYVALVKHNPRYRQALSNSTNAKDYADALQKAGYATDPEYSEKISQIANGQTMLHVSDGLGTTPAVSQSNI